MATFTTAIAVEPKVDCPHINKILTRRDCIENIAAALISLRSKATCQGECAFCEQSQENWLCLECADFYCSRYCDGHMLRHYENEKILQSREVVNDSHCCALSMSDASFWCFECDSYITNSSLRMLARAYGSIKFQTTDIFDELISSAHSSAYDALYGVPFTKDMLIEGLRTKQFRKICFLLGAGISVAAGIPDFRTPGTGLYAKVAEHGLPKPEAIFSLDYFMEQPETFYSIAGSLMMHSAKPVTAHRFIKKVQDEGMLLKCFTQNIDGLELDAGLDPSYLVQAHGHMRSCRCCICHTSCSMDVFHEHLQTKKVLRCSVETCTGVVKPDVIFFGESLPEEFRRSCFDIKGADLIIIMGTSLKVAPFSHLVTLAQDYVPVVMFNHDNVFGNERSNFIFFEGDIESSITDLCSELSWDIDGS